MGQHNVNQNTDMTIQIVPETFSDIKAENKNWINFMNLS